jgi:hypothetical protein
MRTALFGPPPGGCVKGTGIVSLIRLAQDVEKSAKLTLA